MLRKKNNRIYTITITLLVFLLAACNGNKRYHQYQPVSPQGWAKGDTICFSIALQDTNRPLRMSVELRHTEAYPYSNLYLFINQDTVAYRLADENGKWTGKGLNSIYQNKFAYKTIELEHPDTLLIKISQGMTDEQLQGISDVGICVEH